MEAWDLYTKDRERTGKTIFRGEKIPEGYYRLVVHVCIFNHSGQMLVQKRQTCKNRWPGLWDLSIGGHVIVGESTQQAGEREMLEELGHSISLQDKRPALTLTFGNGFDDMYTLEEDLALEELSLQKEEVSEIRWATREEVMQMIDDDIFIPYHKSLIELLFFLRNHSEAHTKL
jgi:isopentenyldiphosphate isomerase